MALASTSFHVVDPAPQNGFHQCLYPQGELQLPPASLGASPRSASGSDPGSFQITASALGLGACEILCAPFKNGISFLQPSGSPEISPDGLSKPNVLGVHLPSAGPLGWGAQCEAQSPRSLGTTSAVVIIFPFVGCLPQSSGSLYHISPLPTYLNVVSSLCL